MMAQRWMIALTLALSFWLGEVQLVSAAEKIIAVVNDDIITQRDIEGRIALSMANTGLPNTVEVRQKLVPQTLRTLVDETLQVQEAKRLNLVVSEDEILEAMGKLAQQNKISVDGMENFLAEKGVPLSAMKSQIRASISWSKVAQRRLRASISIGEAEIDGELDRIKSSVGKTEYLVGEIFLAVDDPQQESEVRRLAERLVDQMSKGAPFPAVARQFSQSATAASGGDLGWIQQGQLSEELDRVLQGSQPKTLSQPIRDVNGYHILAVRDQRVMMGADPSQIAVKLKQLFLPMNLVSGEKDSMTALKRKVDSVAAQLKNCEAMAATSEQYPHTMTGDLGEMKLSQMPDGMAKVLASLAVGTPSPPLINQEGALILMICDRQAPEMTLPSREQISYQLSADRMGLLQRRLLRDLRQAAFIDVRQ